MMTEKNNCVIACPLEEIEEESAAQKGTKKKHA
jgi:hypothetical protein